MTNHDVALVLLEIADLLEVKGEDPFKVRAYRKAAQAIGVLPDEVADLVEQGRLLTVPGIGKAIAAKVTELVQTGELTYLGALRQAVPPGVLALTQLPGLGAKMAQLLYTRLGIDSLDRLELAARAGELRQVPGITPRKETELLAALQKRRERGNLAPLGAVLPIGQALLEYLQRHPDVKEASLAGAVRRQQAEVTDIDLVVATEHPTRLFDELSRLNFAGDVIYRGPERLRLQTTLGRSIDVTAVPHNRYGLALLQRTGSEAHLRRLGPLPPAQSEAAIYQSLGLPYILPELREDRGEVEAARQGGLPGLVELQAIKGDLHMHTRASDGTASLQEMAAAAYARGYQYIAICDHSPSLVIANGLTPERVRLQGAEIARVQRAFPSLRILRGSEVDILKNGALDLPDDLLAELDVVVASIHSHMRLPKAEQTERLLRAIYHPAVDIIGHLTGRVLGRREPYELDFDRVLDACLETGTALELSASPSRLDISDELARLAIQRGVKLVINTDAHAIPELDHMAYGVGQARRAWCQASDILNTMGLSDLLDWLTKPKGARGGA